MKHIILSIALTAHAPIALQAEDGKHLFILSGQSNMGGLDPKISFVPTVHEAFGAEKCIVIKDAQGGQPIRRWYKKWKSASGEEPEQKVGDLYDRLMKKVGDVTEAQDIATVTFVWMQGESDANKEAASVYEKSMQGLIDQLSKDLGRADLNVVIGRISDCRKNEEWETVRKAEVTVAESNPRYSWVDTDDLNDRIDPKSDNKKDDLHYTKEGYKTLGERFAKAAIEHIRKTAKPAAP